MKIEKLARKPMYSKYLRDVMVNISKLTLTYKEEDKMCNVQLITLNKEEKNYMYSFNNSFLSFDLKIGSETACLISQGTCCRSRGPECLIHFCRIFVLAEGMK